MKRELFNIIKIKSDDISEYLVDIIVKHYNKIFLAVVILFAFVIRIYFVPWQSGDYINDLKWWFLHFTENGLGGFKNIYTDLKANYPPLYMFIMALMSYLPQPIISTYPDLFVILYVKIPSILSDFLTAYIVYKFIYEYTNKKHIALLSFAACLFTPMVIFNSSLWGQVDSLYSTFVILSAYLLWKKKYLYCFLSYGISFAFKTQAIFFLPFLIILFCKKIFPFRYFFIIPVPHIFSAIFSALCGADFLKSLKILGGQRHVSLSNNAPSLPLFLLSDTNLENFYKYMFFTFFILLAILMCAIFLLICIKSKKYLSLDIFILWALVITFSMPFLLPSMHERFFYIAEIFALMYLFMKPKYFYITFLMYLAILNTYLNYLFGNTFMPMRYSALLMFITWVTLLFTLYKEIKEE